MKEFKEFEISIKINAVALSQYSIGSSNYMSEIIAKALSEHYKNVLLIGSVSVSVEDNKS